MVSSLMMCVLVLGLLCGGRLWCCMLCCRLMISRVIWGCVECWVLLFIGNLLEEFEIV